MPMPDMAAFLVFPTGSETGGQPQFMLFSFFPGGNIKHHIWWYRGTRFSDEAFHIWPWQVHAVLTIAGARRRELFRLVFRSSQVPDQGW